MAEKGAADEAADGAERAARRPAGQRAHQLPPRSCRRRRYLCKAAAAGFEWDSL